MPGSASTPMIGRFGLRLSAIVVIDDVSFLPPRRTRSATASPGFAAERPLARSIARAHGLAVRGDDDVARLQHARGM